MKTLCLTEIKLTLCHEIKRLQWWHDENDTKNNET